MRLQVVAGFGLDALPWWKCKVVVSHKWVGKSAVPRIGLSCEVHMKKSCFLYEILMFTMLEHGIGIRGFYYHARCISVLDVDMEV